jgi:hypothetical protein
MCDLGATHKEIDISLQSQVVSRKDIFGLVRLHRNAPGIVPGYQSLYKLEKQSDLKSFRHTNPTQTNKAFRYLLSMPIPCVYVYF